MRNCSFAEWKMYMTDTNETTIFLETRSDILSSLSSHTVYLSIAMYILSVFIVAPNFILIWGICRTNKKLNFTKNLFIYHSLTNSLMGLVALPYFALVMRLGLDCQHMAIANAIGVFSIVIGNMTVCQISLMRFISIVKPFKEIDRDCVLAVTLFQFTASFFMAFFNYSANVISITLYPLQCIIYGMLITVCIFTAMLWNWLSMFFIGKHKKIARASDVSTQRNVKAIRRLTCITIAIGLCFLPTSICYIYFGSVLIQQRIKAELFVYLFDVADLVFTPAMLCPGITAFVFIGWDNSIKKYYRRLLCLHQPSSSKKSVGSFSSRRRIGRVVVEEVDSVRLKNFKTFSIR